MANRVGQQLGKYHLTRLLGRGSFAEVYLGEHVNLRSEAAVKVLRAHLVDDDAREFLRESQITARLAHPHIVRILDYDVQEGVPFLVMDYAPNGTLRQRHLHATAVPLSTIVQYVKQVADALQYAHNQRLIHRDVKPENMLIGRHNEILLSDFGTVQVVLNTHMETNQKIVGTVAYMSPENLQGHAHYASDQYALGIVVYEWLTGERPFHGSLNELISQQLYLVPPPIHEKIPSITPALEEAIQRALAKDYRQRFASVQAFAAALEQAYNLSSITFLPSGTGYVPPQPMIPVTPSPSSFSQEISQTHRSVSTGSDPSLPIAKPIYTNQPEIIQPGPTEPIFTFATQPQPVAIAPRQPPEAVSPALLDTSSTGKHRSLSRGRMVLLLALALLVIAGGTGFFYLFYTNQIVTTRTNVLATAQAIGTSTAQANASAAAQAMAAATTTVIAANPNPYPPGGGTLALYDTLLIENIGSNWDSGSINCAFTGNGYHVTAINITHSQICTAESTNFSNFVYEVRMNILQGDVGGVLFRADSSNYKYYLFFVARNGYYNFFVCTGKICNSLVASAFSSAIKQGLNQTNVLTVVALQAKITLYVNGKRLTSVTDSTFSHGQIGLLASPSPGTNDLTEVNYSYVRVWTL
jgi:serine/threonine protein kinase